MTRYLIVPIADVTIPMLNLAISNRLDAARKSLDGSKCILEVSEPVNEIYLNYVWYTKQEIEQIVLLDEWLGVEL